MKIETDFDIDSDAFLIQSDKVVCAIVKSIEINVGSDGLYHSAPPDIVYEIAIPGLDHRLRVRKETIFPTKEALLASL